MSPGLVTGNLGWDDDPFGTRLRRGRACSTFRHLLVLEGIEGEGSPVFRIVCPAVGDGGCPELHDPDDVPGYCVVADQFANIGREIIQGRAYGNGPWLIDVEWDGYGEDTEMWINLVEEETEPALPVDWVVSA